ncbi:hypothetical protein G3435_13500 [Pseudomonas sp. MAFF212428]|uniref:Uncharacterized protein n=1 Tax=Pseudomonas brassicae TaxID=2708063 RepID=A0A6B3P1C1_9PSED|nr:hypothetical protein [Pseudomonas brassicae]NER60729.1 hypothetical protein [Pseudomonas brassicae]NER65697.1 hypothetical protein [Pseudomonas brassicae]
MRDAKTFSDEHSLCPAATWPWRMECRPVDLLAFSEGWARTDGGCAV